LSDGLKETVEIFPLVNAREDSRHNRVLLLPKDVLRAERHARERGLDVVGYYHSHPNAPAVPSQYDLDHALPVWSYVIVSVMDGKPVDIRSWEMEDDRSKFNEEKLSAFEERFVWQSQ
jgi:proteasome lid subunit RPN8/RPN11